MKTIKISDYFKVVKPQYVYLRLKPANHIRNHSTEKIAKVISSLYKTIFQQIKADEKKAVKVLGKEFMIGNKFSFEVNSKVSYFIYIEKQKIEFYFIVPDHCLSIIKERISDSWGAITIDVVKEIPSFSETATKRQLVYKKEDGLSLAINKTNNDLLRSNLNIVDVMEEGDKVGIFYNFLPTTQFSWSSAHKHTLMKVKQGLPVDRDKFDIWFAFRWLIAEINSTFNGLTASFGKKETGEHTINLLEKALERINGGKEISECTKKKATSTIVNTQIALLSESKDNSKQQNNIRSLVQSFDSISGDNYLIAKPLKKAFKPTALNIGAEINKMGHEECHNLISLPGRELLESYNFIEKVETTETQVPEDLRKGTMCIGANTYRGHKQKAYLTTHHEYKYLTLVLIGPTRAGKSTLIGNLARDALKNKECVILFDFIKRCELSQEISSLFPLEKVLTLDCGNYDALEGLGYNEIGFSDDTFDQYSKAKDQTEQLQTLVNAIHADDSRLSSKMERYLGAASMTVFLCGGSIKQVFDVLQNHKIRSEYMKRIPEDQKERMEEYIGYLEELNDYKEVQIKERNKKETILQLSGTKDHLITGIIDRLYRLKANAYMEEMLKRSTENNVDLSKEIQKPQLICIKMPESKFKTKGEKDICTTYWITKLWGALQVRGERIEDRSKHTKVNMVIDEIYQVETTEKFLTDKLSQMAKFGVKPIISCHYINQMKHIRQELRSAHASYMLVAGCDKKNFDELKEELYKFTAEDLLRMKSYHSMNLIKNNDGYGQFITKLPKPVSRIRKVYKLKGLIQDIVNCPLNVRSRV
jgi:hypothetical protein